MWYNVFMSTMEKMAKEQAAAIRERRQVIMHLQDIEGNPLHPDDIAMFEMFDRECWSHARRRAYVAALEKSELNFNAAE